MSLDAIGIAAKSIEHSLKFYGLFGLDFKMIGEGHHESVLPSGMRIMIDSFELLSKIDPNWTPATISNITLCFKQSDVKRVDKLYSDIINAGYKGHKEPWDAFWGQRYASVKDPSGNQIDIFADVAN